MRTRALTLALLALLALPMPTGHAVRTPPGGAALTLAAPVRPFTQLRRPRDADGMELAAALVRSNRYLLGTWWQRYMAGLEPYYSAQQTMKTEDVRRFASAAFAIAVALQTRAYDPGVTDVPIDDARYKAVQLVQFLVRTHKANSSIGWGDTLQSALWAGLAAHAGWLMQADVPVPDQLLLARMLEHEADTVAARRILYLRDREGVVNTPGNTWGEENAWDGMTAYLAAELLPHHPHRVEWTRAAYARMVASYSRPSDVRNDTVVNGLPVSSWLDGSNAEQTGLVVNHGFLHPDYMTCVGLNLAAATVAPLVGDAVPEAAKFNAELVYGALQRLHFSTKRFHRPGGTIYVPGSSAIYYPQGTDWGVDRQVVFATFDEQIASLELDTSLRIPARTWAQLHLSDVRRMQARSSTGQTYQATDSNRYPLREEQVGLYMAWAYLTRVVAHNKMVRWHDAPWTDNRPR